ncbi:MAG: M6 family metalloprotease domain-containing protein [Muribaculaceae bacterium]|nr:M6 family metalloprotease domain-containing protein [Muribaculaceae bacterium]
MKKFLLVVVCFLTMTKLWAIIAIPNPQGTFFAQPDGTSLAVTQHGDAFYNYYTTIDGFTIVKNGDQYEYAQSFDDGSLTPSGVMAHNAEVRSPQEQQFVAGLKHGLIDQRAAASAIETKRKAPRREQLYDYNNFRGLIVLVEYTDKEFEMDDPHDFYDHMVNDKDYKGFTDKNGNWVPCTGSVRDYYYDQSGGKFDPVFDIVGPVKVNYASTDHNANKNTPEIFKSALDKVDPDVDFSIYDGDSDGFIDFVFFIGAGPAACYVGNDSTLLWPHAYVLTLKTLLTKYDGLYGYKYACCTEIYGWTDNLQSLETQGIGVMCHEFSHVLGLKDHYDADYDKNGLSHHPGFWDVMAAAPSLNVARTPAGFSLYERWALGWVNPPLILEEGPYKLNPIDGTGEGYILITPSVGEYFTLENRQRTKWDEYLPGHGMLITRVDSTNMAPWTINQINTDASHNYLELVRAWNDTPDKDLDSDPFPGTKNVTSITNTTTPNLKTWGGMDCVFNIHKIKEKGQVVSFYITYDGMLPPEDDIPIGDVNNDGKVDVEDVNAIINIILEIKTEADYEGDADLNGDGKVDVEDVNAAINIILTD